MMKSVKIQMFYAAVVAAFLMVGLTAICYQAHGDDSIIYPSESGPYPSTEEPQAEAPEVDDPWVSGKDPENPCKKFPVYNRYVGCRWSLGECRMSQATPSMGALWVKDGRDVPECTWGGFPGEGYGNVCCLKRY